jgi:AraC family transcriptional regulator of adaptative response/methylated-DNA-[protein]-cysteine methyltransferase
LSRGAAWNAILTRDRNFDGKFVYAVRSTGLYCRPSCPARHPLRRNTAIFESTAEAERKGFLPCSRCAPRPSAETVAESCVKVVIRHIESNPSERITLGLLSQRTGLSPNYLQEAFTRIVGVTPKGYSDLRRIDGFKARLRLGDTIAEAGYRAGYGSSRALYEPAGRNFGMTPATYQRGGDLPIRFAFFSGSLGPALLAGTRRGLCAVLQGAGRPGLLRELRREFPRAALVRAPRPPDDWIAAVRASEQEDPFVAKLPLVLRRRIFRARVRDALS